MKDHLSGFRYVVIFLVIMAVAILIFVGLVFFNSFHDPSEVYVTSGYLFPRFFKEPFETVVFLFKDGQFMTFSTHQEKSIEWPVESMMERIKKGGLKLEDCIWIVHNHFGLAPFSQANTCTLSILQRNGFSGEFSIYYTASKKVRSKETK
jgi:hypothetical protein